MAGAWGAVPEFSVWAPMLDDLAFWRMDNDAALRRDGRELLGGGLLGGLGLTLSPLRFAS